MTVTFLVAVVLDDTSNLQLIAEDIADKLDDSFEIESVKPWARPSDPINQPAGGFMPLNPSAGSAFAPPPPL